MATELYALSPRLLANIKRVIRKVDNFRATGNVHFNNTADAITFSVPRQRRERTIPTEPSIGEFEGQVNSMTSDNEAGWQFPVAINPLE